MFMEVERVSDAALRMSNNDPGGRPHMILLHKGSSVLRTKEPVSFGWICKDARWPSYAPLSLLSQVSSHLSQFLHSWKIFDLGLAA